jgi:hypothetical protein
MVLCTVQYSTVPGDLSWSCVQYSTLQYLVICHGPTYSTVQYSTWGSVMIWRACRGPIYNTVPGDL